MIVVPYGKLHDQFSSAELLRGNEGSLEHSIKISNADMILSRAFEILLDMKDKETIKEFSVAQSTLEQVFLYFARYQRINPPKNPWKCYHPINLFNLINQRSAFK